MSRPPKLSVRWRSVSGRPRIKPLAPSRGTSHRWSPTMRRSLLSPQIRRRLQQQQRIPASSLANWRCVIGRLPHLIPGSLPSVGHRYAVTRPVNRGPGGYLLRDRRRNRFVSSSSFPHRRASAAFYYPTEPVVLRYPLMKEYHPFAGRGLVEEHFLSFRHYENFHVVATQRRADFCYKLKGRSAPGFQIMPLSTPSITPRRLPRSHWNPKWYQQESRRPRRPFVLEVFLFSSPEVRTLAAPVGHLFS